MDPVTIKTLAETFGPTGAIIIIGLIALRGMFKEIWPWVRDQYLARMVVALEKLAVSSEQSNTRLAAVEQTTLSVHDQLNEVQKDQAALFGLLQAQQPSRPRQLARGATTK